MRRIGWLMIILLLFDVKLFGQAGQLYVKEMKENIRLKPNGKKIGEILAGTKVEVLERRPNWVKVQFTGWIWRNSLTADSTEVYGFTVSASHILVETETQARQILNQLKQGASFEELARKYSIDRASGAKGGDLGRFGRGDFLPAFEKAVFHLKVGEVSGIVKTNLGYHIIKRTG